MALPFLLCQTWNCLLGISGGRASRRCKTRSIMRSILFRDLRTRLCRMATQRLQHRLNQIEREREDDRRVLLNRDLCQCLEEAQLQGTRLRSNDTSGLGQLRRCLQLAFSMDDLRALLTLGL